MTITRLLFVPRYYVGRVVWYVGATVLRGAMLAAMRVGAWCMGYRLANTSSMADAVVTVQYALHETE